VLGHQEMAVVPTSFASSRVYQDSSFAEGGLAICS
jgi:hypothetical protein